MKFRSVVAVTALVVLSACGGGGDDDSKDLFSLWKSDPGNAPLDLTGRSFNTTQPISIFVVDGSVCNCNLTIIGDQESGAASLNSCTYVQGTSAKDPGCQALFSGALRYRKSSDLLTLTYADGSSTNYR